LLENGKAEFKKEFYEQDFIAAANYLERAVGIKPKNAEARYFLGYTYGRLNSPDGESMPKMSLEITLKASEQLEIVNKLEPKYSGEILFLDPYSKISSE
jgi:hypothetical protein